MNSAESQVSTFIDCSDPCRVLVNMSAWISSSSGRAVLQHQGSEVSGVKLDDLWAAVALAHL